MLERMKKQNKRNSQAATKAATRAATASAAKAAQTMRGRELMMGRLRQAEQQKPTTR